MLENMSNSRKAAATFCYGVTLDSGIGYGYTLQGLIENPNVTHIVAAEILPELCEPWVETEVQLECRSVLEVLEENPDTFDCITWDFGGTFIVDGELSSGPRQNVSVNRLLRRALREGGRLVTFDYPKVGGFELLTEVQLFDDDGELRTLWVHELR